MDVLDAAELIAPAVAPGETWADLGAGTGTFTAALARLVGPAGRVIAIERDAASVRALEELARQRTRMPRAPIVVRRDDFTLPLDLHALAGALLANALHFVPPRDQPTTLRRLGGYLRQRGSLLVIEYDDRPPSRWVPFPISQLRLAQLANESGWRAPEIIGQRHSEYGGTMYVARLRLALPA